MLEPLEAQNRLTANQWKIVVTANLGDVLEFFDFYLIGYALAFILRDWHLTYGRSAVILLASGLGAVPGAFFWGWLADRIGRRNVFIGTAVQVAVATALMAFTPDKGGWLYLAVFRFFVGFGTAGVLASDLPLVQEFVPSRKRGLVSALSTILHPAGSLMAAVAGAYLAPVVGWRGLFLVGLMPLALVLVIRWWVPESPRWLLRMGRFHEARSSLAWALQVPPEAIALTSPPPALEGGRWREIFRYPRSVVAACLTSLTQTGTLGLALWLTTLFVMLLKVGPARASSLLIWFNLAGILGRAVAAFVIEVMGRRLAGTLGCLLSAVTMALAGEWANAYVGGVSVFFVMVLVQNFFGGGNYSLVTTYIAELWPTRLRASGMGFGYGVGNLGKIIGPLGLALIAGSGDYLSPQATFNALGPAFLYFASWWVFGAVAFWFIGFETKGRSLEEIDSWLDADKRSHMNAPERAAFSRSVARGH